jgi:23S rRNA (uracil1939-C5)-methyltransferase
MEPLSESDLSKLISYGENTSFHIYLQPNSPAMVHKIWPLNKPDRLTYTLPDFGLEFLFHPLDFTQINLEINRLMVRQAIALLNLQPEDRVLDLFCGIGNFTLPLARHAQHVTGIEGGNEMVARAQDNARHNGISNVDFHAANLMEPTPQAPWMKAVYDKILLDPPRAGALEILPFFRQFQAKRIVYVSCNPATLARDAGELVHQQGYKLLQAGIMNMFPHTSHIEAMAVFEKT